MPWKLADQRINKQDSESDHSTQLQLVPKHIEVKKLPESNSWK